MSWNYRVFHRQIQWTGADGSHASADEFTVREAYYDDDGKVNAWSADPMSPHGETMEELSADLALMAKAFLEPVVEITPDASALSGEK